jgi:hypothetical protein
VTKATKAKRATKLDQLMAQGGLVVGEIDGRKVPYFAMPTSELQSELSEELTKKIKKDLKADGYELLHPTRRDHPFHSDVLRGRIDELVSLLGERYDPTLEDEAEREEYAQTLRDIETKFGSSACEEQIAAHVARALQESRQAWAKGVSKVRDYLRDPKWWKGTYLDRILNPAGGPPLPTNPLPKPVYVSKQSEIVLSLRDGFVNLYARIKAS